MYQVVSVVNALSGPGVPSECFVDDRKQLARNSESTCFPELLASFTAQLLSFTKCSSPGGNLGQS